MEGGSYEAQTRWRGSAQRQEAPARAPFYHEGDSVGAPGLGTIHPLDPNFLTLVDQREHYIYGDDHGDIAARVDAASYWFFSRWRWAVKYDKRGRKPYLYRTLTERTLGRKSSLFLHVAILQKFGPPPPTPQHTIADHGDGDTLECRLHNLDWATASMNAKNRRNESYRINGKYARRT